MAAFKLVLKNQKSPAADIEINETGVTIAASGQFTVDPINHLYWTTPETIAELTPFINSGDIVINNGITDLSAADALLFLEYPDRITIQENDVDKTRVNKILNFEGAVTVTDNGSGKTTVNIATITADPFLNALFDEDCNPLFSKDEDGTVTLLEACT